MVVGTEYCCVIGIMFSHVLGTWSLGLQCMSPRSNSPRLCSTTCIVTTSRSVQILGHLLRTVHYTLSALTLAMWQTVDVSAVTRYTCLTIKVSTCMVLRSLSCPFSSRQFTSFASLLMECLLIFVALAGILFCSVWLCYCNATSDTHHKRHSLVIVDNCLANFAGYPLFTTF